MNSERIESWCNRGMLALVLLVLVAAPLSFGAVRISEQFWLYTAIGCALVLWSVKSLVCRNFKLLLPPAAWAGSLFFGFITWNNQHAAVSLVAWTVWLPWLAGFLLFFLALDALSGSDAIQWITLTMITVATIIAAYAIYQYVSDSRSVLGHPQPLQYRGRGSGTYVCPNHLAGYLELILPLALAVTLCGKVKPVVKILTGYAATVILAGIVVSGSRGGWVSIAISLVGFFAFLLRDRNYRFPALVCLTLLLGAGAFVSFKTFSKYQQVNTLVGDAIKRPGRGAYWPAAVSIWRENYWTGAGSGHYDLDFRMFRPRWSLGRPDHAHNDYLELLAEQGIIGFTLFMAALGCLALSAVRVWKYVQRSSDLSAKPGNRAAFVLGAMFGLLAFAIHSIFDFNAHIPANSWTALVIAALLNSHYRHATERFWFKPGWAGRIILSVAALGGAWLICSRGWHLHGEDRLLNSAELNSTLSEERLDGLKKANAWEPLNGETCQKIGELLRLRIWDSTDGFEKQAAESIRWFKLAQQLNPLSPYGFVGEGLVQGWLKNPGPALHNLFEAHYRDPQSYYVSAHFAWFYCQIGQYQKAVDWGYRSVSRNSLDNPMAWTYLKAAANRLRDKGIDPDANSRVLP